MLGFVCVDMYAASTEVLTWLTKHGTPASKKTCVVFTGARFTKNLRSYFVAT